MPKYVDGTMLLDEVTQAAAAFAVVSGPATGSPTIMRALPNGPLPPTASLLLALDQIDPSA